MNQWQVTAVLKSTAVEVDEDGGKTVNFTAVNQEKIRDAQGNFTKPVKTYIDCQWVNPDLSVLPLLVEGAFVFLQGKPYLREFTRRDKSVGWGLAMTVSVLQWQRQLTPSRSPEGGQGDAG